MRGKSRDLDKLCKCFSLLVMWNPTILENLEDLENYPAETEINLSSLNYLASLSV